MLHPLFARLADGPAIVSLTQAVLTASQSRDRTARRDLTDDHDAQRLLPALGWQVTRYQSASLYGRSAPEQVYWSRGHTTRCFITTLTTNWTTTIQSMPHPGGVTQRLRATDLESWWHTTRADLALPETIAEALDPALVLAWYLADQPGPTWTIAGDTLERTLPPWPLRYAPHGAAQPRRVELKHGLLADCVCWSYLPAQTVLHGEPLIMPELAFLSLVGPHKKLKAVWASLMDSKRDPLKITGLDPTSQTAVRRMAGKQVYQTFWNDTPLATSRMAHLVIQHSSALQPKTNQPFVHITGADGTPDVAIFAHQFDCASTLPVQRDWARDLWDAGRNAGLITPMPSWGCQCFWVDSAAYGWHDIVAHRYGATSATLETYGTSEQDTPQLAQIVTDTDAA